MADQELVAHYARTDLHEAILAGLAASGKDPDHLGPDDLMAVEDFHTLGRLATLTLAQAAGVTTADHVLDAGSGLGGPARTLARSFGCRVTGVDLSGQFCDIARDLNARSGLAHLVEIVEGNILELPFEAATFDVAWSQHVAMNIADKSALYASLRRVLRPGGRLAFFDVIAGEVPSPPMPLPWADQSSLSFLEPAGDLRAHVEGAGFAITDWADLTPQATAFWQGLAAQGPPAGGPPPLGVHLLMGNLPAKVANMAASLAEDRIRMLRCVATAI